MVKYMGSKNRIFKHIYNVMDFSDIDIVYDLFCGGGNFIDKISPKYKRIACDIDRDIINALILIRDNVNALPKNNTEFTENDYQKIKKDPDNILYGYVAFALSFGAKKWGGWRRDKNNTDYVASAYRSAVKQSKLIQDVDFICCSYDEVDIKNNSLIYCDPPYVNTTQYAHKFDHEMFYNWCRKQKNKLYVSEYYMPSQYFKPIWEMNIKNMLQKKMNGNEKLWILKEQENDVLTVYKL